MFDHGETFAIQAERFISLTNIVDCQAVRPGSNRRAWRPILRRVGESPRTLLYRYDIIQFGDGGTHDFLLSVRLRRQNKPGG
jgi:hypothetical protein